MNNILFFITANYYLTEKINFVDELVYYFFNIKLYYIIIFK